MKGRTHTQKFKKQRSILSTLFWKTITPERKKEIINNNEKNRIAANALREELIKDLNTQENKSADKNEENKGIIFIRGKYESYCME